MGGAFFDEADPDLLVETWGGTLSTSAKRAAWVSVRQKPVTEYLKRISVSLCLIPQRLIIHREELAFGRQFSSLERWSSRPPWSWRECLSSVSL
jgi:hypothetical protein